MKQLGKTTFVSLMATFLGLTVLMVTIPFAAAGSGYTMYAPPLTVTVTVDGMWSGGEWADAPQYNMSGPAGQTSYIRAKFNTTHLFVIIDSPWDTSNSTTYWYDNTWLAFDTNNDGGYAPQTDDYLISCQTGSSYSGYMGWVGNGTGWNDTYWYIMGVLAAQAGEGGGNPWAGGRLLATSPNDPITPHRIDEFAVPLWYVGFAGSTVGFYAQVEDQVTWGYSEWPMAAGGWPQWPGPWGSGPCPAPSIWGNLKLASAPATLAGDANNDGVVNILDIVWAALAFGSTPWDPNWNPYADLNPDGVINIIDLVVIGVNF